MTTEITDPAILAQLNGGAITDPAILAQLNASSNRPSHNSHFTITGNKPGDDNPLQKMYGDAKHAFDKVAYGAARHFPDLPKSILSDEARKGWNANGVVQFLGAGLPSNQNMKDRTAAGADYATHSGRWGALGGLAAESALMAPLMGIGNAAYPVARGLGQGLVANMTRAGAVGGTYGSIINPENTARGATEGALGGMAGQALGQAAVGGIRAAGRAAEGFYNAGRERILKRSLESAGRTDAAHLANTIEAGNTTLVPGIRPTLGEASGNPGIGIMQRGVEARHPETAGVLHDRRKLQVEGYRGVLDDIAGTDGTRDFYAAMRREASDELYAQAHAGSLANTPALQALRDNLLQRPSVQRAIGSQTGTPAPGTARAVAAEAGVALPGDPRGSVLGLDYTRRAVSGDAKRTFAAGDTQAGQGIRNTADELRDYLVQASPRFGEAVATHAEMSKPINQMDVGRALRNKAIPALTDHNEDLLRFNANSFAQGLREDGTATVKAALNRDRMGMSDVMDPAQMARLNGVADDAGRYAAYQNSGLINGSTTAQHFGADKAINDSGIGAAASVFSPGAHWIARALGKVGDLVGDNLAGRPGKDVLQRAITDPSYAVDVLRNSNGSISGDLARGAVSLLNLDKAGSYLSARTPGAIKDFGSAINSSLPSGSQALVNALRAFTTN